MRWLFRPAATLLGRLRYAHKFVVVGLVLLLPLGFVAKSYVDLQDAQIAFSARERVGVAYMAPLVELTATAVAARHEVSTGSELGLVDVGAAIARVEEADRRHGAALGVGREWAAARDLLVAANVAVPAGAAFHAYNRAVDALLLLIVHVGDRSNLTLDPDLDTYYLVNALQFRLPILLDVTSRAVDRAVLARRDRVGASTDVLIDLALANGVLANTRAALHTGIGTSVANTRSGELRRTAPAGLQAVDAAVAALEHQLTRAVKRRTLAALQDHAADPARTAMVRFTGMTAAQLDRLLAVRIAGFSRRARTVELVMVAAVLLAIWLFAGFYLSVAGPVRRMVAMLQAVAAGDLDQRVELDNRDELRFIASTLNDTVATTRAASERLAHQARHDLLTGLPNRAFILDRLERSLRHGERPDGRLAVLFVDLDRFKPINDSLGHEAGDEVLRTVADRLRQTVRPVDTVGRLAGDEFVVVCDDLPHERDAVDIATRLVAALGEPIVLRCPSVAGREAALGASVGVAFAGTGPSASPDELLGNADVAMYHAKQRGRGRVEIFDERLGVGLERRVMLQEQLLRALHDDQFRVVYQPVADATNLVVSGFEALVRWEHPSAGTLSPAEFIPVAEETGLIVPLGARVLREACRQAAAWRALPEGAGLEVSVNLSAHQLADADLVATVTAALGDSGLPADALWLEITESTVMADVEAAGRTLGELRALGIRLAIDDFGTGYSSLAHLRRFPIEQLKIDRSFTAGLGGDPEDEAIVGLIVSLARTLRLGVVAEGVETAEQLACLRRLGCDTVQGFHVGRPLPPDLAFAALGTAASTLVIGHR